MLDELVDKAMRTQRLSWIGMTKEQFDFLMMLQHKLAVDGDHQPSLAQRDLLSDLHDFAEFQRVAAYNNP